MRLDENGRFSLDAAELRLLAAYLPVGVREVGRRDGYTDRAAEALAYQVVLLAGRLGDPTLVASVTSIEDAPSRRVVWRRCEVCGESTDKLRRNLEDGVSRCNACRMYLSRHGHDRAHAAS